MLDIYLHFIQFFYEFTKILLLSETYRRPIRDLSETHRRPTCFIGDPSETDMPHRRPTCLIGDQHASSETDMPHQRPTCLIGDPSETHRRPTCLIRDRHASSETDMSHRRPIRNTYLASLRVKNCFIILHH